MAKVRLDTLLHQRGLFSSRSRAAASVMAGEVRLGTAGERAQKPGQLVAEDVELAVDERPRFVSRGGIKLANALTALGIDPAGRRCLDVGASTGGFTDCLLQASAAHVVAVDVAYGELDWSLRTDDRVTLLERVNARALKPAMLPWPAELVVADVSFISLRKVLPAVLGCTAPAFDALVMVKPQFEVGRERVGSGGVVREAADRRAALLDVAHAVRDELGVAVLGFASSGLPGPKGNRETFAWLAEAGRAGALDDAGLAAAALEADPGMSVPQRVATVMTHQHIHQTAAAMDELLLAAAASGFALRFDEEETAKHHPEPRDGLLLGAPLSDDVDVCIVLGGDGTILRALRRYAGTSVPVFAVNFGEIGFLATIDRDEFAEHGFERAFALDFDTLTLPALALEGPSGGQAAINDVSFHRRIGDRVPQLSYLVDGEEVGAVRCDGLVVCTPAGSTGYNLANGGPVLAWGVEGYVVSFIAPHTLTARALVVAPDDQLEVRNRAQTPVDVSVDGRPGGELGPGEGMQARFVRQAADLAQMPGTSFYERMRDKFGRLAS